MGQKSTLFAFLAFYVSLSQATFNAVSQTGFNNVTMTIIAPVLIIGIIGILLLAQISHVAASISGGIATSQSASALGRAVGTANSARLAFRNPLNYSAPSRREVLQARSQARTTSLGLGYRQQPEFQKLRDDLKRPAL